MSVCSCMYTLCVCLYKWLLCSSDNAMVPAEARGYECVCEARDWLMCYTILSDGESPFTAVPCLYCPEGMQGKRHLYIKKVCVGLNEFSSSATSKSVDKFPLSSQTSQHTVMDMLGGECFLRTLVIS